MHASTRRVSTRHAATSLHIGIGSLAVAWWLLPAAPLRGGEITGITWYSGIASVAGEFINPPSSPNNDDQVGTSPNVIYVLQKNYWAIGTVDLVFDVVDSGGVTEYLFVEGVWNGTGIDWSGYHLELGFGHGAGFVKATADDGLDFDAPDYNSDFSFSPWFATVWVSEYDVITSDGLIPTSSYASGLLFHIDVPDGITSFTLRQSPIAVPEPSSGLLAGLGLLAVWFCRRPRQR